MRRTGLLAALLIALTLGVYWPVRHFEFINCDDPQYVSENVHVQGGLSWAGVRWAFTTLDGGFWHPLTWLSLMLDCQLFGPRAGGYHLTNLLLHVANTLLLFAALKKMTGTTWRSAFLAALFALHPLRVESVAWISDRKDLLAALFWMLSLLMYARYVEHWKARSSKALVFYGLTCLFFLGSMMSKATALTLPLVLLLLDWWPLRRFEFSNGNGRSSVFRGLLWEKVPLVVVGASLALVALYGEKRLGAVPAADQFPMGGRCANALLSYVHYLAQTLWPTGLAAYYPYPTAFGAGAVAGAALLLVAATGLVVWAARRRPYLGVGWFWFMVTLLPAIGLLQVGGHARADRFTYVPLIGLFLLLIWGACDLIRSGRYQSLFLSGAAILVVALCLGLTRRQLEYWKDSEAVFRRALEVSPDNPLAHGNLGSALASEGHYEEAVLHFRSALRLAPTYLQAHLNLGNALAAEQKTEEALQCFRAAVECKPASAPAHYFLANALALQRTPDEAKAEFLEALRLKPDYAEAHTRLGNLLLQQGAGEEALRHLFEAVRINNDCQDGHYYLATALARQNRMAEATKHFRLALQAKPDQAAAMNDLAWILATERAPGIRNVPEALRLGTRACELTGHTNAAYLDTLGVVFSEAGRLADAIKVTDTAAALAASGGQEKLLAAIRAHQQLYQKGLVK